MGKGCGLEAAAAASVAPTSGPRKPYEEIAASFNGNEVKIRVPKSCKRLPEPTASQMRLTQQCTCDEAEAACPETCGLGALGPGGPGHRLCFQIPDDLCEALAEETRTAHNSQMMYSEAHQRGAAFDVTPEDAPRGVHATKLAHPDKDVFVLKIGKQTDEPGRTGDIELELVTPRAPAKPRPPTHRAQHVQCDQEALPCCALPCRAPGRPRPRHRHRPPRTC